MVAEPVWMTPELAARLRRLLPHATPDELNRLRELLWIVVGADLAAEAERWLADQGGGSGGSA
jgi:hypothetical protein